MNWIDAKEKLPEKDGRYLVIENHYGNWIGISSMRNKRFDMEITHWMNLPPLPKVKKQKCVNCDNPAVECTDLCIGCHNYKDFVRD